MKTITNQTVWLNGETIDSWPCDIDESKEYTTRDAKKILTDMGYYDTGRGKGSHNNWKHKDDGHTFPLTNGKTLSYGVSRNLDRVMKERGYKP